MLNQRKDISEVSPPLLLTFPTGNFHLITSIEYIETNHYVCNCVKRLEGDFIHYQHHINDVPFYVAENIWELKFGVEIMTLLESDLINHPATRIWQEWINQQSV